MQIPTYPTDPPYPPALINALEPVRQRLAEIVEASRNRPRDRTLWRLAEEIRREMNAIADRFDGEEGAR